MSEKERRVGRLLYGKSEGEEDEKTISYNKANTEEPSEVSKEVLLKDFIEKKREKFQ